MARVRRTLIARLAALALVAVAWPASATGPQLATPAPAAPPAHSDTRHGVLSLAGGAYAYLPAGLDGSPVPLLVAFYGAGGNPENVLESFKADAERDKFVLLIPVSEKGTWDMIEDLKGKMGAELNPVPHYGRDLKALDAALADLFAKVAIDPARVGAMGFSDGATYALSVGTANPQLFSRVVAFSPGPAFPGRSAPSQRVFVSHGREDEVLSFSNGRSLAGRLKGRAGAVEFVAFDGRHEVPKDVHQKAIAFFLAR